MEPDNSPNAPFVVLAFPIVLLNLGLSNHIFQKVAFINIALYLSKKIRYMKSKTPNPLLTGLLAIICILLGILIYVESKKNITNSINSHEAADTKNLPDSERVVIVSVYDRVGEMMNPNSHKATVTVKNNTIQAYSSVFVKVYYYGANNNILDTAMGEIDHLPGNGEASVECLGSPLDGLTSYKAVIYKKFPEHYK
jgi:hypothetical protein